MQQVVINTNQIGDDNDYSCILKKAVRAIYKSGDISLALLMFNTDTMLSNQLTESEFITYMNECDSFDKEVLETKEIYSAFYNDRD